jgi:CheY-like chemotaxis protein
VYRTAYDVETAASGAAGLALLAEREFDVVLADFNMPGMNGDAFTRLARDIQRVAVVIVSGYLERPEIEELQQTGMVFSVLQKPWNREAVSRAIEDAANYTANLRARLS